MAPLREASIYLAKLAEQAGRFEEMVENMKTVASSGEGKDLTIEERNLLSIAYKSAVGVRRASWRIVSSIEMKEGIETVLLKEYKIKIEGELTNICKEILNVIQLHLIPSAVLGESRVFYYKMKADYYRYLAEITTNEKRKENSDKSLEAYKTALVFAVAELPTTHPTRLGLVLNFSVFYFEILKSPEHACTLAKQAFDDAIARIDTLPEEGYRLEDTTLIMHLLRDNLILWTMDSEMIEPKESYKRIP